MEVIGGDIFRFWGKAVNQGKGGKEDHLNWTDLVFVSAMSVQKESVKRVIARCKAAGVRIVAAGPLLRKQRPT
jgi:hypothetical protein